MDTSFYNSLVRFDAKWWTDEVGFRKSVKRQIFLMSPGIRKILISPLEITGIKKLWDTQLGRIGTWVICWELSGFFPKN